MTMEAPFTEELIKHLQEPIDPADVKQEAFVINIPADKREQWVREWNEYIEGIRSGRIKPPLIELPK